MNLIRMTAFVAVVLAAFACNQSDKSFEIKEAKVPVADNGLVAYDKLEEETRADKEKFPADTTTAQIPGEKQKKQQQTIDKPDWDKKIIKTASLNVEVKDYNTFYRSLRDKIRAIGGYVAREEQTQSDYKIENSVTIKVPVDQFDNALIQVMAGTEKINEKKIGSQDVTTDIVDTKSRMEAKKQVRLRYLHLLEQAKNMEEILSVQSEINGIQEEIESAAGRLQYLGHSTTFSTINLTYYQVLNSSAQDTGKTSFATKLSGAFNTGWSWIGDLFIGLVSVWPLLLIIFLLVFVIRKGKIKKPILANKTPSGGASEL